MKYPNYAFIGMAAILMLAFSCSSDSDFKKENPLKSYLAQAEFTLLDETVNSSDYEFGIRFIPKVAGNITDLVVKLPDDRADLRVTIWDATTKTVLRTETIDAVTAATELTQPITPLALTKDKEYMITFNSNDWYNHEEPSGASATYPIKVGNIEITGYGYSSGTTQTYPTDFYDNYYAGDCSFKFLRTK